MDKTIYIDYEDRELECFVEYVQYVEARDSPFDPSNVVKEVINVFLPDGLQHLDKKAMGELKVRVCEEFHNSHGGIQWTQ